MAWFMLVLGGALSVYQHANSNEYIVECMEAAGGRASYDTAYSRYDGTLLDFRRSVSPLNDVDFANLAALWRLEFFESPLPFVSDIDYVKLGESAGPDTITLLSRVRTLTSFHCENLTVRDADFLVIPPQVHLRILDLSDCKEITAKGISFASQANMLHIRLRNTGCGQGLWSVIGRSENLEYLDLRGAKIVNSDVREIFKRVTKCRYLDISHTPCLGRSIGRDINGRVVSLTIDEIQLEDLIDANGSLEGVDYLIVSSVDERSLSSVGWLRRIQRMSAMLHIKDVDVIHQGRNLSLLEEAIRRFEEDK